MAKTVERSGRDDPSPKDVGRHLRQVRKQQGLSRGVVARSAGLTRRELAAYERGRAEVPESDLWCLAGSCGVEVSQLLPQREALQISPDLASIGVGDTIRRLRGPAEPDGLLREYLAMISELRNLPPGSRVPLRAPDLAALADALGGTPEAIERKLTELVGASPEEAARLRAMILPPPALPSAPPASTADPYAELGNGEVPPAVEQFFSAPGPTDPFAAPDPTAVPLATMPAPPEVAWPPPGADAMPSAPPADPFGLQPAAVTAATPIAAEPSAPAPPADPFGLQPAATDHGVPMDAGAAAPTADAYAAPPPPMPIATPPEPVGTPAADVYAAPPDLSSFPPPSAAPAWPTTTTAAPFETTQGPAAPTAAPMPAESPAPAVASPSNPFAGPVDPQATAAASLQDPFAPPPAEDPLAPTPLPPDPFAAPTPAVDATPPASELATAMPPAPEPVPVAAEPTASTPAAPMAADATAPMPEPMPPSSNGHGIVIDDPFARPAEPATPAPAPIELPPPTDLGLQALDAIVVDDPMAGAPAAPPAPAPAPAEPDVAPLPPVSDVEVLTPGPAEGNPLIRPSNPITWNAGTPAPAAPIPMPTPAPAAPAPTTAAPAPAPTAEPASTTGPRFERASAHWQIGGIFPATAMADDGTLALRRADARWALTDLSAPGDFVIEAAFDFRAGSGFGVVFRGSVDDGERITGYSFDVDPIAGGGGYLVRLWEGSRQHWRPLAQAPVTDPAQLYGRHVVRITLRADQLTVLVDGDPVLEMPALSRCTLELGREPCRGDRVGVQAWSTTEVTAESFRVANL